MYFKKVVNIIWKDKIDDGICKYKIHDIICKYILRSQTIKNSIIEESI